MARILSHKSTRPINWSAAVTYKAKETSSLCLGSIAAYFQDSYVATAVLEASVKWSNKNVNQ